MSRREQDPQPRHPVDPSRRRRIEDPDEYKAGKEAGDRDRPNPGKANSERSLPSVRPAGHCRRAALLIAVPALLICFPVLLPLAVFCAVALLATPRSGHLGRRHTDPRHLAGTWGADRSTADTTSADDGPCCPAGNPSTTPSSKGKR